MSFDLRSWSTAARAEVDATLEAAFPNVWPPAFLEPLRYPLSTGGKRFRPLLTLAAFEALGGTDRAQALPGAAAVELIHTYSLVHDDLPAMDDDDERRGKPTVHIAFDEPTAILVGDGLLTHAFAMLAAAPLDAEARIGMVADLSHAAGHLGMVGGQVGDITLGGPGLDLDTLQRIHRLKTGALIRTATTLGGRAAGADATALDKLAAYGEAVGLAFQLADDVLDEEEDEGEDGPPSYVRLLGAEETLRRAHQMADEAVAHVSEFAAPDALIALARFTVERDV
jgi:geranylgeranyl pyrophosphate synthase